MQKFGLTSVEAKESLAAHGNNSLTQPPRETFLDKLWGNFQDPIIRILILALVVNAVFVFMGHGDWLETIGIFVAIILATFVSTYSEFSNENAFQKLQADASRIRCKVWRDGEPVQLSIDDIVVGDAVILESGDKIPVDGVLLDGEVKVDQAALNGESEEAAKEVAPSSFGWDEKTDFLNPYRMYRGSVVVEGQGIMKAVCVGDSSVYGQLTQELKDVERDSPLQLKLRQLAGHISVFGYTGGIVIALAVMLHWMIQAGGWTMYLAQPDRVVGDLVQAVILAVIIVVMAVPEGLPLMVAIVSSLNMKKMLKDNVLVRKLVGIETAGSLNLLFTDKTGTITRGHLEVVGFIAGDMSEYPSFTILPPHLKELTCANITLNTSAVVTEGKVMGGNMTERALNDYLGAFRPLEPVKRLHFHPFNSTDKFSWALVEGRGEKLYLIKGAPEKLVARCGYYWCPDGSRRLLDQDHKEALEKRMLELAGKAIRMLALCSCEGTKGEAGPDGNDLLTLVGVVAIRDEVRQEAIEAVAAVQNAGVQLVMITGDRKETAVAIAKDAGIIRHPQDLVWSSSDLAQLTDDEVKLQLRHLRVVARALPMDKLRLVKLAQELNLVVGMTGDGVNDSPALKRADVGFAMGSGTEVAKEAGDIVILDDNFLSIKQAILYGRTIYNSICKFITFQLTINFSAVAINFVAPFLNIDKPLTIVQILWINLVMDTLAALAFGGEPALEKYLEEKPKRRNAPIISKGMLSSIALGGLYMTIVAVAFYKSGFIDHLFRNGPNHIYTYTGFFCTYVFLAVANGFNVRVSGLNLLDHIGKNQAFLRVMALIVVIQVLMTYIGGPILRTRPLQAREWAAVVVIAFSIIIVDLVRKAVRNCLGKTPQEEPTNK